jgi:ribosomal protein L40E
MGAEENISENPVCWACGAAMPPENNYCGKCGQGRGRFVHWYYKHTGAVFLTLTIGPFALYFIWRSPVLSRGAKCAYTAIISIVTWYVASAILGFWRFVRDLTAAARF